MTSSKYVKSDFVNENEVRWCPGCGDYAILAAIQRILPELGLPPEKHVFISGIGCAGRLPYYINAYGFHTIHGRALAVATGVRAMREDLTIWVITGDGDALSIGGNHFLHCLRRNLNINILLLNNQVYGLTKGQFSPTSQIGQITKTSPLGVTGKPINAIELAIASGATFVARAVDKDPVHLASLLKEAYEHKGCSLLEIYQDCHVFNKGAFDSFSTKTNRTDNTVMLQHGKPLLFGETLQKKLILSNNEISVELIENKSTPIIHDETDKISALRLAGITNKNLPVPLGVYYKVTEEVFKLHGICRKSSVDLQDLYTSNSI